MYGSNPSNTLPELRPPQKISKLSKILGQRTRFTPINIADKPNFKRQDVEPKFVTNRRHSLSHAQNEWTTARTFFGKPRFVQQTCLLLSNLPLEIRLKIYEYCLIPSHTVHIIQLYRRMIHQACDREAFMPTVRSRLGCLTDTYYYERAQPSDRSPLCRKLRRIHHGLKQYDPSPSLLPLLRCCRQVYAEAIDVLYRYVRFDFAHPETFNVFVRTIPLPRLALVSKLSVSWQSEELRAVVLGLSPARYGRFYEPLDKHWAPLWVVVRGFMPGLRELSIQIAWHNGIGQDTQEKILEGLRGLKGLTKIDVTFWNTSINPNIISGDPMRKMPLPRKISEWIDGGLKQ